MIRSWYRTARRYAFAPGLWLFLLAAFYGVMLWYAGHEEEMPLFFKIPITLSIVVLGVGATIISILLLVGVVLEVLWEKNRQQQMALFLFLSFLMVMAILTGN